MAIGNLYRAETPHSLVPEFSSLSLRHEHISLTLTAINNYAEGALHNLEMRASQTSCEQGLYQLSYTSASNMAETKESIQDVTPRQALRNMKKKFAKLEEKKELAI